MTPAWRKSMAVILLPLLASCAGPSNLPAPISPTTIAPLDDQSFLNQQRTLHPETVIMADIYLLNIAHLGCKGLKAGMPWNKVQDTIRDGNLPKDQDFDRKIVIDIMESGVHNYCPEYVAQIR